MISVQHFATSLPRPLPLLPLSFSAPILAILFPALLMAGLVLIMKVTYVLQFIGSIAIGTFSDLSWII
jgi:hypothetical protein